jgi:oligoribonuclease
MTVNANNLIWIDMEMTGLDPENERIIEIATIVTDSALNTIAEGPVFAVHQSDELLQAMDNWNTRQHNASGLVERVKASKVTEAEAEQATLEFLRQYVPEGKSPMCGNSVHQDRRFLCRYMPQLEKFFHYRLLDVSTLKELAQRWAPQVYSGLQKESKHLALDDIRESIEELKYYRAELLNPDVLR